MRSGVGGRFARTRTGGSIPHRFTVWRAADLAAGEASPADIGGAVAPGGPFQDRVGEARRRTSAEWRAFLRMSALPSGGHHTVRPDGSQAVLSGPTRPLALPEGVRQVWDQCSRRRGPFCPWGAMTTAHLDALSRDVVARHPGEPEFPGFGVVCLAQEMSATRGSPAGTRCLMSGSGNVALYPPRSWPMPCSTRACSEDRCPCGGAVGTTGARPPFDGRHPRSCHTKLASSARGHMDLR